MADTLLDPCSAASVKAAFPIGAAVQWKYENVKTFYGHKGMVVGYTDLLSAGVKYLELRLIDEIKAIRTCTMVGNTGRKSLQPGYVFTGATPSRLKVIDWSSVFQIGNVVTYRGGPDEEGSRHVKLYGGEVGVVRGINSGGLLTVKVLVPGPSSKNAGHVWRMQEPRDYTFATEEELAATARVDGYSPTVCASTSEYASTRTEPDKKSIVQQYREFFFPNESGSHLHSLYVRNERDEERRKIREEERQKALEDYRIAKKQREIDEEDEFERERSNNRNAK